jgi:hypothetical protein
VCKVCGEIIKRAVDVRGKTECDGYYYARKVCPRDTDPKRPTCFALKNKIEKGTEYKARNKKTESELESYKKPCKKVPPRQPALSELQSFRHY